MDILLEESEDIQYKELNTRIQ